MMRGFRFLIFGVCLMIAGSMDVMAQRTKGGAGGGRSGGASKGATGGNRGGVGGASRSGGFSGGFGRSGGSSGIRATGGMNRQPSASERTSQKPDFQNSINQIRGTGTGAGQAGREGIRPQENNTDRRPNANSPRGDENRRTDARAANDINQFNNGPDAFTSDWYRNHPNAWRYDNPNANVYAFASTPNMMRWWGYPAGGNTVVIPGGTSAGNTVAAAPAQNPTENPNSNAQENQGEWLPIGVFSLSPQGKSEVTRALQLATNKSGQIKGNHIDLLSDTTTEVHGRFDAETKTLQWTIGNANGVLFTAPAQNFNNPGQPIPVESHYADGTTSEWVMTPIEKNESGSETSESE